MPRNPIFGGAVSLAALCAFAPSAFADINADDVWTNMSAYTAAMGGDLTADLQRSGDTVTANDIKTTFVFPNGAGQAVVGLSGVAMIENADGTVSILYAADPKVSLSGVITGEGDGGADLILHPGTYSITASGVPGDITYDSAFSDVTLELVGLNTTAMPAGSGTESSVDIQMDGWTSQTRVTEGELVSVAGSSEMKPYRYSARMKTDTLQLEQSGSSGAMTTDFSAAFPAGGSDLLNLGAAFEKGMFFDLSTSATGTTSTSKTTSDGRVVSDQTTSQGNAQAHLRLDRTALTASGRVEGTEFSTLMDGLPFVIAVDVNDLSLDMSVPVSASPDEQPFKYALDMSGLRFGNDIWAQFDPDKAMPREPADFRIDLSGKVLLDINVLDGASLMAAFDGSDGPVRLTELKMTDFRVAGLGTLTEAIGSFIFHNDDLTTFFGFPRPEGSGSVTITGLNALLDLMIGAGTVTQDDVMGLRMSMGMFTDSVGDDQIRSELLIDGAGGVTLNGQRIK